MPSSPRSYYYAPVRGRQGAVATGIGQGIERGVEAANRNLQQRRDNRRQDEQDDRQRLFDEMEIDDFLNRNRGGRGEMPARDMQLRSGSLVRPSEGPRFLPDAPRGGDPGIRDRGDVMSEVPEFGGMQVSVPRPDSRYRPVGPEGDRIGYVMTPEAIEEEDYLRALGREEAERGERMGRLGPIAEALAGGSIDRGDAEFGRAALEMSEEGYDPFAFIPPEEEPYQPRTRDEYFLSRGRDPETGRSVDPRSTGGARDGRFTENQALMYLQDRYATEFDEDGYPTAYGLSEDEMIQYARDIAAGRPVQLPPVDGGGGGGGGGFDPDAVRGIVEDLQDIPRRQWEETLRQNGASDALIEAVMSLADVPNTPNTFRR